MARYKVLVADDHFVSRRGIQTILEFSGDFEIVGEARNGVEAVEKAAKLLPDIVLMDIRMPELDGLNACRKIRAVTEDTSVLILSAFEKEEDILKAIEAGACGYLLKDVESDDLIRALELAGRGLCFLHPAIVKKLFARLTSPVKEKSTHGLTKRELEILDLIAQGLSNEDIAKKLWVTIGTVKTHVSKVLRKLQVSDRSQAVIMAIRVGLIKNGQVHETKDDEEDSADGEQDAKVDSTT